MKCPRCQQENPSQARFCMKCGASLTLACARCGTELPAGAAFCFACGQPVGAPAAIQARFASPETYTPKHLAEKILTARSALEGERKPVTVLFCDLANSTALAERLGPEAMHGLLNRFFELALSEVHRYEGTINQFLGDGFMALFGAPLAHEDHARRAVLAALGIQRRLREPGTAFGLPESEELTVRMGLNTGPVVVGKIGDNLRMDYTAVGDTTHLAARLQQIAEPGTILLSEASHRLIRGYVRLEAFGPVQIKGKTEPIPAFKVLGLGPRRSPLDVRWERALSRFVGREREMGILRELLGQAEAGQGQAVGIVGEPGLGKSRLLYEFRQSLGDRRVTYLEGRCLSYGSSIPYLPVLDIIRTNCGITETDPPEAIGDKVRFALQEVGMDPEEGALYLLHLLGVKDGTDRLEALTPDVIKARTLETLRQLSLKGSQRRLLIFAVEDLHWIDRPSEEYFVSLVESLTGAPILLLSTYRPGYRPPWIEKSYATQLALRPLAPEESLAVLRSALQQGQISDALARVILEKAEGNPLFLEELARAVEQRGELRAAVAVPDTLQGVIMARIDRLPEESKRLLQTASVLGREVSLRLLAAIWEGPGGLDPHLAELKRLEFLYEQTRPGESVYVFKHALTQEVAYESLLHERRKLLHAKAVEAIERLYGDRLAEHAETLAYHALRGEVWDKAVDYLREAGTKAHARGALQESLERFEHALEIVPRLSTTPENLRRAIDVRLDLHLPLFVFGQIPRLVQLHREAEQLARQLNDQLRLGRIGYRMGTYSWMSAQYSRGIEHCEEALRLAIATNDSESRILGTYFLGVIHQALGNHRKAIDLLMRLVEGPDADLAKRRFGLAMASPYVASCGWLVVSLAAVGDFQRAIWYGDCGVRDADTSDHAYSRAFAYTVRAFSVGLKGEFAQALPWLELAVRLCETKGVLVWLPAAYSVWGWSLAWSGQVAQGLPYLERGVTVLEGIGAKLFLPWLYFFWAEALLLSGNIYDAKRTADKAFELAIASSERGTEADALRVLGDISAASDPPDFESAHSFYERAEALAAELGMRPLLARCHLGLGRLYRRTADQLQAYEHLTTAATMFREMDMRFWLEQAEAELKS